jgi:hypothetical protein
VSVPTPAFGQAQCGGVERWPVKVGSDPDAGSVDTTPTTTTLHDLVRLPTPDLPHDDETRAPEERTLWRVEARLLKFKPELGKSGDNDYRLVIVDHTLQFSQGQQVSTHSFAGGGLFATLILGGVLAVPVFGLQGGIPRNASRNPRGGWICDDG